MVGGWGGLKGKRRREEAPRKLRRGATLMGQPCNRSCSRLPLAVESFVDLRGALRGFHYEALGAARACSQGNMPAPDTSPMTYQECACRLRLPRLALCGSWAIAPGEQRRPETRSARLLLLMSTFTVRCVGKRSPGPSRTGKARAPGPPGAAGAGMRIKAVTYYIKEEGKQRYWQEGT